MTCACCRNEDRLTAQGCGVELCDECAVFHRARAEAAARALDVDAIRANLHATFNGGHHGEPERAAFHHGMDTVCNVLAAHQKGESTNGIIPAHDRAEAAEQQLQALQQENAELLAVIASWHRKWDAAQARLAPPGAAGQESRK